MRLHLGGYLNFYSSRHQSDLVVELPGRLPLTEVLQGIKLPEGDIFLTVLNGELVELKDAFVTDQDRVELYPPMGGG